MAIQNLNFLTVEDIDAHIFKTYINERSGEDTQTILETIEAQYIALIQTKLKGRYDTDAVFAATGVNRHYIIVKILTALVIYSFIRRNAARKVPSDYVKEYEWAMAYLDKINAGREVPDGLPVATDNNGNPDTPLMYGNNTNTDFYI